MRRQKNYDSEIRCSSCKDKGHTAHSCPKDPNARTYADPVMELQRVSAIRSKKQSSPKLTASRTYQKRFEPLSLFYDEPESPFEDIAMLRSNAAHPFAGRVPVSQINEEEAINSVRSTRPNTANQS